MADGAPASPYKSRLTSWIVNEWRHSASKFSLDMQCVKIRSREGSALSLNDNWQRSTRSDAPQPSPQNKSMDLRQVIGLTGDQNHRSISQNKSLSECHPCMATAWPATGSGFCLCLWASGQRSHLAQYQMMTWSWWPDSVSMSLIGVNSKLNETGLQLTTRAFAATERTVFPSLIERLSNLTHDVKQFRYKIGCSIRVGNLERPSERGVWIAGRYYRCRQQLLKFSLAWNHHRKFEVPSTASGWSFRAWRRHRRGRPMTRRGSRAPARSATLHEWKTRPRFGELLDTARDPFTETISETRTLPFRRDAKFCYLCSPLMWGGDHNPTISEDNATLHIIRARSVE